MSPTRCTRRTGISSPPPRRWGIHARLAATRPIARGAGSYAITTRGGVRWSAASAFLRPARRRANVTVRTGALVDRLDLAGGHATGVRFRYGGRMCRASARRDLILSAGAIGSPAILQRSGLGPADTLQAAGLPVRAEMPHVGRNLQDHLGVNYFFRATEPTLNTELGTWTGKARAALRYALTRRGPLALSVNQCGGFFRSGPDCAQPDQQLYFNPVTYTTTAKGTRTVINPDRFSGFVLSFQPSRPTSRGRIAITSPDPSAAPAIEPGSLATDADLLSVVAGGRLCRDMAGTEAISGLIDSPLGPDPRTLSDAAILEDFRRRCSTVFHPVGTCRMSRGAAEGVVDARLRVHGIDSLRVVDASVFPQITSGNTNAPTMMVACRAADFILEAA